MSKECNRVTTIDYNLQTILSKEDSGLGAGWGGGLVPPLYKPYRYVLAPAPSGRVFAPFWSENRYTLYPFWSGIGYDF